MRAISDCAFFVLPAADFGRMIREWFPMAMHLLEGLFFGMRNSQALIGERQRLTALGSLTAGLMHELNNPAAAAVRATAALRQRVAGMRHKLGMLADGRIDPAADERAHPAAGVRHRAGRQGAEAHRDRGQRPRGRAGDWLDAHGITAGWLPRICSLTNSVWRSGLAPRTWMASASPFARMIAVSASICALS